MITDNLQLPNNFEEIKTLGWQLIINNQSLRLDQDDTNYREYLASKSSEQHLNNLEKLLEGKDINLVNNQFPYTLFLSKIADVKHKMILSKRPLTPAEIDRFLIENCFLHPKNYYWFENQNVKKSVPNLFHVHVFIKI